MSRLVDGAKRPELTEAGRCVQALWRAVHGLNAALTASEYAIMPDHVHLLLIVDYDRDPGFNPLVFIHWFMEESARMIATDGGLCPPHPPEAGLAVGGRLCPPHPPEAGLADPGRLLPTSMRRFYDPRLHGGTGAEPPFVAGFWEDGFWLDLSFDARQLKAIRSYIRNNPLRARWKRDNPDMFVCRSGFRHPVLDPVLPWSACGDLTLLASPFLLAVSLTRKKTLAEHEPELAALVDRARRGWIVVCGFLSPGEKELGRRLRAEPRARWIKTLAQGLPPRYDPSLEDSRYLAEHRQLLLSALPVGAPFSWETCHAMNAHAMAMCRRAREGAAEATDGGLAPPAPPGNGIGRWGPAAPPAPPGGGIGRWGPALPPAPPGGGIGRWGPLGAGCAPVDEDLI